MLVNRAKNKHGSAHLRRSHVAEELEPYPVMLAE